MLGLKSYFKEIKLERFKKNHTLEYAKKIGVNICDDCRMIDCPDFSSEPWLITIGKHVTISFDVVFLTHDGGTWVFRDEEKYKGVVKYGRIEIGDNCFIGARSTIMPNVKIGNNCIVGACSLVTKSIPDNEVWGGVPAKYICKVSEYADKCFANTPEYDNENLIKNRKEETIKIAKRLDFKQ